VGQCAAAVRGLTSMSLSDGRRSKRGLGTEGVKTLLLVLYPLLAVLVAPLALAGAKQGLSGFQLFNDPAHELGTPLWGVFSYFAILMWAASTTCCVIAWIFLTRTSRSHPLRTWFLASAVLSGALTIDDTFAIHDVVLFENMGISERRVFLIYSIPVIWYLVRFRRELLDRQDSALFMVSLLFLGSSLAIDVIHRPFPFVASIEDLTKLLGITAWLYFFFRATFDVVTQTHSASELSQ
jgi:hypothetical protein